MSATPPQGHGRPRHRMIDRMAMILDAAARAALRDVDDVLLHSPRAAAALADLWRECPLPRIRALAISPAALAPLAGLALSAKLAARRPNEAELLRLIDAR